MSRDNRLESSFTFGSPQRDEPEQRMPEKLSIVDYPSARAGRKLGGGAYDPYENIGAAGDTARVRRPRVDLRKLSEWIQATQRANALREAEATPTVVPARK
jgi:hypothetical protein